MNRYIYTSVPQSNTTGSCREGWIPAQSVVITSLATDMRIAPTPWSPMPNICKRINGKQDHELILTDVVI